MLAEYATSVIQIQVVQIRRLGAACVRRELDGLCLRVLSF